MTRGRILPALYCIIAGCSLAAAPRAIATGGPQVTIVTDQAEAALAILELRERGESVSAESWERLWSTEGFRRFEQRQQSFGGSQVREKMSGFLSAEETLARLAALRGAVDRWRSIDVGPAAMKAARYLPEGMRIRATIYPVIKRAGNSFVFDLEGDPAIFMYIDPQVETEKLENTLAHELHHVGSASCPEPQGQKALSPRARQVVSWLSAFGEGLAMLAAAGGPDVHPHASSPADEWLVWERDVAHFNRDLRAIEEFFAQILAGDLPEEERRARLFTFINTDEVPQGGFYTVGWKMAAVVERARGREALLPAVCDPRVLLEVYNEVAAAYPRSAGESLATWSSEFLEQLRAR